MLRLNIPLTVVDMHPHVNGRRQKHGQENVRAADVSFTAFLDGDEMLRQLCTSTDAATNLSAAFWDSAGAVREVAINQIVLGHKIADHNMDFTTDLDDKPSIISIKDVTLRKFVIVPKQGRTLEIRFQAQAKVTEEEFGRISEGLVSKVRIAIEPKQVDHVEEAAKAAAGSKGD